METVKNHKERVPFLTVRREDCIALGVVVIIGVLNIFPSVAGAIWAAIYITITGAALLAFWGLPILLLVMFILGGR